MQQDWESLLPVIRPTSRVELWRQVHDQIAARILAGDIPADEKIWAQEYLADELGTSRGTIIRAYEALQQDGLVVFVKGRGIFTVMPEELVEVKKRAGGKRR